MVVLAFGTGAFAWISRGPAVEAGVRRLPVTGVVVAAPEGREVRIAHDDIAGYMLVMVTVRGLRWKDLANFCSD